MKAFKVTYKHGHFIDIETTLRLVPVQGAEYIISANEKAFKTEDAKLHLGNIRNSKEKEEWIENKFGKGNYVKILNANEQLFFRVGNSKSVEGDESREYIFVCTLLEDLYFHLLKEKEGESAENWRLSDCKCVLEDCLMGGLTLSAKIPADSLNQLFSQTVMFYFNMQRSGVCNAYKTFFKYTPNMQVSFGGAVKGLYDSLENYRNDFFKNQKEKKAKKIEQINLFQNEK